MGTISTYPIATMPLDGTEQYAAFQNGQQVTVSGAQLSSAADATAAAAAVEAATPLVAQAKEAEEAAQAAAAAAAQTLAALGTGPSPWPRGAHKAWRLNVTGNNGGYSVAFGEIGFASILGGAAQDGGTAFGSTNSNGATYAPSKAFDGATNSKALIDITNQPMLIGLMYPSAVSVNEVNLSYVNGDGVNAPKSFDLQWSDNTTTGADGTWSTVWSVANQTGWTDGTRTFDDPLYGQGSKVVALVDTGSNAIEYRNSDGSYSTVPTGGASGAKSANTQALIAALKYGFFPKLARSLPAADTPTITNIDGGSASPTAGSTISNPKVFGPDNANVQYLMAPAHITTGEGSPIGAYYGGADANGNGGLRASYGFSLSTTFTGTTIEVSFISLGASAVPVRVEVNGCYVADVPGIGAAGGYQIIHLAFPASGTRRIELKTRGQSFRAVLTDSAGVLVAPLYVPPLVTMFGDSYVEGLAAESPANGGYPGSGEAWITGRALGCNPAEMGVGGTGLFQPGGTSSGSQTVNWLDPVRLKDLTLEGTGIVPAMGICFASINDGSADTAHWQPYGNTYYNACVNGWNVVVDTWRAKVPSDKPLVLFGPTYPDGSPTQDIYTMRDACAVTAMMRRAENVFFLDRLMPPQRVGSEDDPTSQTSLYTAGGSAHDPHPIPRGAQFDGLRNADQLRTLILTDLV